MSQQRCHQQEPTSIGHFVTSTQGNTIVTSSNNRTTLNHYNYPPPIAPIINGHSLQQLNNLQIAISSSQQQPHICNYYSTSTHNQHLLNDSSPIYQNQMQQYPNSSQMIPFMPNLPHQSAYMPLAPHLPAIPSILPISGSIAQNHLTYMNTNPQSASQILQNNISIQYHYTPQQQFNLAENNSRLHVSHSAPNLQKNGSFTHPPPLITASNLPIFCQIQPQLQNTLQQQQPNQNIQSNCNSTQNYLPLPISKLKLKKFNFLIFFIQKLEKIIC